MTLTRRRKKRPTKRTYKTPRCDYQTPSGRHPCKKPQAVRWSETGPAEILIGPHAYGVVVERGMCQSHAKAEAHIRVREFVRQRDEGRCVIPHADLFPCAGVWQPNHGFDRDEKSCTWAEWNVMGGCAAINTWAHHNKFRWYERLRQTWGDALYEERRQIVLHGEPMDLADVLAKYPAARRVREAA